MDLNMHQIEWDESEYKLKFVLDNPNFELPQIVQVIQGHMVDEDDAIASGQILTIHGKKKVEKITGHDIYKRELHVNIDCPYKVNLITSGVELLYERVSEFCLCENPPKYLKIKNDILLDTGEELAQDSTIEVGDHVLSDDGKLVGVICKIVSKTRDSGNEDNHRVITLPIDYKNIFTETLSPEVLSQSFTVAELTKNISLPFQIQFLPVANRNCGYGPHLGVITVEQKKVVSMVLATSVIESVTHALTFSVDLPITIQVAQGIKDVQSNDCVIPNTVDLSKFDYLSNNDPYDTAIIQNEVYDELATPRIPRRSDSCLQRQLSSPRYAVSQNSFHDQPRRPDKSFNHSSLLRKNKSLDLSRDMKDLEKYVKSKLGFKKIKSSVSKLTNSKNTSPRKCPNNRENFKDKYEYDAISQSTFVTSEEDGSSSTGVCSIDITSNGSGSTCNESYNNIIDCMDAMSVDQNPAKPLYRRRKGSGDSGICLSGRKKQRSRSRSRLTPDTPSSNQSDSLIDNLSEWSIPVQIKESLDKTESNNYLWSAKDITDTEKLKSEESNDASSSIYEKDQNNDLITDNNNSNISPLTTKQLQSMDEIRKLTEEGVAHILDLLQLSKYKGIFQMNQINGELLLALELSDLLNDCKLSLFQAKKIIKYVNGWRPEIENKAPDISSRRNSLNPRDWSVADVFLHMSTINLSELGRFCSENQVNGDLLLDILDKDTLHSLSTCHNVKMSNLEAKKLLNFVVKGWRPDNSPKKTSVHW